MNSSTRQIIKWEDDSDFSTDNIRPSLSPFTLKLLRHRDFGNKQKDSCL